MNKIDHLDEDMHMREKKHKSSIGKSKFSEVIEERAGNFLISFKEDEEAYQEDFDILGCNNDYKIEINKPLLSEIEQIEEENLLLSLEAMNLSYQSNYIKKCNDSVSPVNEKKICNSGKKSKSTEVCFNKAQQSEKTKRSSSHEVLDHPEFTMDSITPNTLCLAGNESCQPNSVMSTNCTMSIHYQNENNILAQNLVYDTIKLIIIGDKGVGKTTLANALAYSEIKNKAYEPTMSLEIKKHLFHSKQRGNNFYIELWDTNTAILKSQLIHTYFKICDGFLLVCDHTNPDSFAFLDPQIENIINHSTLKNCYNIQIIVNLRNGCAKENTVLETIERRMEKFQLSYKQITINIIECPVNKFDELLENFFLQCLLGKTKCLTTQNQTNAVDKSSSGDKKQPQFPASSCCPAPPIPCPPKKKAGNCLIF